MMHISADNHELADDEGLLHFDCNQCIRTSQILPGYRFDIIMCKEMQGAASR